MAVPISILATRGGPPSPLKISRGVPPPTLMSLQIRSGFWKGFQGRKSDIWSGLDPQNRAPAYTGAQFSQNRRIPKNTKKYEKLSEKRPPGRDKNRLCDPICLRVGGLAAPAGTNTCPCGSTTQKTSTAGLSKTNKLVQDSKNTEGNTGKRPEGTQR